MLIIAEGHPLTLEEITIAQDQQEEIPLHQLTLLQLQEIAVTQDQQEEALTLRGKTVELKEILHLDAVLAQQEEAVITQILGIIILLQGDPLLLVGIIAAVILEVHHQEALALEVLDQTEVHLPLKKEETKK